MQTPTLFVLSKDVNIDNPEDSRLYKLICLAGFVYFFSLGMLEYFFTNTVIGSFTLISISLIYFSIFILFPSKNIKIINRAWLFYLISFIGFNLIFLFGGGFLNPGIYIVFPYILIVIYLADRKTTTIVISLILLNYTILYLINFLYPSISANANNTLITIERIVSHIMALFFTVIIVNRIFSKYEEDKNKAKESEKKKEAFLENMSHLIRTPLNSINGYSELLLDNDVPEFEKQAFKQKIHSSAKELHHIIFNLIDLSIIQEKSLKIKDGKLSLLDVINSLENKSKELNDLNAKKTPIEFINHSASDNIILNLDGDRLIQLIWNFIENSIHHTSKGSIKICFKIDLNSECFIIIIEDTGDGMDPLLIQQIQNQDILNHNQSNIANPKPGMGILISKGILEYLDGKLIITSELNIGTHISIEIPIRNKYEILN